MRKSRSVLSLALSAMLLAATSGCCTIAHKAGTTSDGQAKAPWCDGTPSGACPWLIGDGLLLIPFLVPGVIAFIVDFSNGEWQHG